MTSSLQQDTWTTVLNGMEYLKIFIIFLLIFYEILYLYTMNLIKFTPLQLHVFILFLKIFTESNLCYPYMYRSRNINRSVFSSSLIKHQLSIALHLRRGHHETFSLHVGMLTSTLLKQKSDENSIFKPSDDV